MEQEPTDIPNKTTQNKQKKKPGRPRKDVKQKPAVVVNGVVDEPNDANHRMELTHCDPWVFKQIISMLTHYFVETIFIQFDTDFVSVKSKDHPRTTTISITIDCNKVSEYFCKEPFAICVRCEYLAKVFATITKSHDKIAVSSHRDSYQSCLDVSLVNDDASIHDNFRIDLSVAQCENISVADPNNYLIKFTMCSKMLKKFINDTVSSKMLTIEKHDGNHLKFKTSYNNKVDCTRTFRDESSIYLDSKLDKHQYFNVNLKLESIKPFSTINVTNVVNIYMNTEDVMFEKIIGDYVITTRIHTEIINYAV